MRWLKLLLDCETSIEYQKLLESKVCQKEKATIGTLVSILRELLTERKSLNVRHKTLFKAFNKQGLFGFEGSNTESFLAQLNRDMEDCRMESFQWTNLSILIMINTLGSSDENEARLAERLNHLYNSAILNNRVLDMSFIQSEVHQFWKRVRESRQMTFNSQKETKALAGLQNSEKEESKENRKRKRKNMERKKKA